MIAYAYVHQGNYIHLHTFWAFDFPNIVSFFSLVFQLWLEVSGASSLSKRVSASLPSASLQRNCFSRNENVHGWWQCSLCHMWWLWWLFLSWETWLCFPLQLLPGKWITDVTLLNRLVSVAVCLYLPHTLLLNTVHVRWPHIPSPLSSGWHLISISLEVTLEISCAQTQICNNVVKSSLKNQLLLNSRAVP